MLDYPERWLEQDEHSHNKIPNDLMIGIELVHLPTQDYTKRQANDSQDQSQYLQRPMYIPDLLCIGQVDGQGRSGKHDQEYE